MNKTKKGKFIVFEGIDGCGKSTQAELLVAHLKTEGKKVTFTREHTRDLPAGILIDQIVNHEVLMDPMAHQVLYVVDRIDHTQKVIKPALEAGGIVVSDRYSWSTIAYSNLIDKKDYFYKIQKQVTLVPDKVIWVDIDPVLAMERMNKRGKELTIFEKIEKLQKVREGYQWLEKNFKKQCIRVDGSLSREEIHREILKNLNF